jgi:hypothetical protein
MRRRGKRFIWESLPDVDRIERFFVAAGLRVERSATGFIVGGHKFPLTNVWVGTTFVDWSSQIDRFVAEQMPERLSRAASSLGRFGRGHSIIERDRSVMVECEGAVVATIRATSASVTGQGVAVGNFLAAGEHWELLAQMVAPCPETARPSVQTNVDRALFFAEVERRVDTAYRDEPRLPDRRDEHPWVTGYLGDPFAPVWFVAESPSLSRVEAASKTRQTAEMQWTVSPGDKLFRCMLAKHGFKSGGEFEPGGWRCYITDVIKSSYRVKDWQKTADEVRLAVAEAWAPVLRFELETASPKLVVVLGKKTRGPLDRLVRKRLIPPLPETVTIYHYSYLGSRPQGKLGPLHPERVAAWDADFARIAKRAGQLGL